jgi:hypothetical protein
MLYRTMLENEDMDMQDPQYIPNVNETDSMQQFQNDPQRMPYTYMGYPMMDEMYDPSTYEYQMQQQQFQIPAEDYEDLERSKHDDDSFNHGYNQGYNHGYGHGYNHGYNNFHQNNFPLLPLLPLLFFR